MGRLTPEYEAMAKANKKGSKVQGPEAANAGGDVIVGQGAAAAYVGVSMRTIRYWVNTEGMPQMALAGGKMGYSKAILGAFKRAHAQDRTKSQLHLQEIEYKKSRTALVNIEVALRRGELVPVADVQRDLQEKILAVRWGLQAVKTKLLARLRGRKRCDFPGIIQDEFDYLLDVFAGDQDPTPKKRAKRKKAKRKKAGRRP